jgi:diaminohydroxyphosphoribosylaminopyrimidine deaminase/5-amino-6-(5-phosphoribosylamino)uracil reductase
MTEDEKYMKMALKLAGRGVGLVEPNPAVGCVIVKANEVIGRGWHKKFGDAHAEINAMEDCKGIGAKPEGATIYVTLEPCCHVGKTGPCSDAIIAAKPARVVVGILDPSEHAGGYSIEQMRQGGIEVDVGVCEDEVKVLNAGFLKYATTKRPWVILKWAQSIDGKLAWSEQCGEGENNRWISNESSRKDAHKLRRSVGGIVIGVDTVIADNPLLIPRPSKGKYPLRIVLDSNLRIPLGSRIINTKRAATLVICTAKAMVLNAQKTERVRRRGVEVFPVADVEGRCDLDAVIGELGRRGIQRVLVEGGARVLTSFLKRGLGDAVRVYVAPMILGTAGTAGITEAMAQIGGVECLHYVKVEDFGGDACIHGFLKNITGL